MAMDNHKFDPLGGPVRDEPWVSEIAASRPKLTTKFRCLEEIGEDGRRPSQEIMSGDEDESVCERFNRELRSGIGTGRPTHRDSDDEG
jgi:hypothetical protein